MLAGALHGVSTHKNNNMNRTHTPTTSSPIRFQANDQAELFNRNGSSGGKAGSNGSAKTRPKIFDGLKAPSPLGKNFVLDTNVLLHDPDCLHRFGDNHVCVPMEVLCELDRFKK